MHKLRTTALIVSVLFWAVMLGGGIYGLMVYFPAYLAELPKSAVVVTGPYGLHEGVFWLTIHPLLILSLIVSFALNWKVRERRRLMGVAIGLYVIALIATQLYFLPELFNFARSASLTVTPAEWQVRAQRWQYLNGVRGVELAVGFVFLLLALTKPATVSTAIRSGAD